VRLVRPKTGRTARANQRMFDDNTKSPVAGKKHNLLIEFVNTLEWLVTAFMLAFVFRAFVMEAFRIPTGSMADTLKGAHFRLQCPECGYSYEHGFIPTNYGMPDESVPNGAVPVIPYNNANMQIKCPSCGYYIPATEKREVFNGDRILVLKCIYQIFEPQRWDVVVFKNPRDPKVSYIKRLIAKPGETVEIIDGDVYINGRIARKPVMVQDELWSVVYDNDYQPVKADIARFNGKPWKQPFENTSGSKWQVDQEHPTVFTLDGKPDEASTLRYNTFRGNNFLAGYSYNAVGFLRGTEQCSDLKVRFHVDAQQGSRMGASLSKYEWTYKAMVSDDSMVISRSRGGSPEVPLAVANGAFYRPGERSFSFVNADHKLVLEYDGHKLEADMGSDPNSMGEVPQSPTESEATILGAGKMSISHVALCRDEHYLSTNFMGMTGRACRGKPFALKADEFLVLGDNSPNSDDCRWWVTESVGNDGKHYRMGVVPRDYLVGKAVFVYWPSGYSILGSMPFVVAPDFGDMRLIYGGSDRQM
jgi:signal peptidase I